MKNLVVLCLAAVVVTQAELLAGDAHEFSQAFMAEHSRRTAVPIKLLHRSVAVEDCALQGDLAKQPLQIGLGQEAEKFGSSLRISASRLRNNST